MRRTPPLRAAPIRVAGGRWSGGGSGRGRAGWPGPRPGWPARAAWSSGRGPAGRRRRGRRGGSSQRGFGRTERGLQRLEAVLDLPHRSAPAREPLAIPPEEVRHRLDPDPDGAGGLVLVDVLEGEV